MKILFDKTRIGESMPSVYHIDEAYIIFRHVQIRRRTKEPEAWFIVRFTLEHISVRKNKLFSLMPMMALFLFRGFREKYWLMDEKSNSCMGVYRWQTLEDAKKYASSIAMRFMTKRSKAGSVRFCLGEGEQPICVF